MQAYDTTARTVVTITSKGDAGLFNPTLAELADAATATPVYFPHTSLGSSRPHEATAGHGGRGASAAVGTGPVTVPHFFIDASVVSGSALLPAIAEARRLWPREDRIVAVVVGPGRPARSIQMPPSGLGGPQWLQVRPTRPCPRALPSSSFPNAHTALSSCSSPSSYSSPSACMPHSPIWSR